jgi:hypothetical protein
LPELQAGDHLGLVSNLMAKAASGDVGHGFLKGNWHVE